MKGLQGLREQSGAGAEIHVSEIAAESAPVTLGATRGGVAV